MKGSAFLQRRYYRKVYRKMDAFFWPDFASIVREMPHMGV